MKIIFLSTLIQTIALIVILAVLFLSGQVLIMKRYIKGAKKARQPNAQVEAKAIVLAVEQTGVFMNQQPLVRLQMQVIPDRGRNFITETKELLSAADLASIRSGTTVTVTYNTGNLKEIALVRSPH